MNGHAKHTPAVGLCFFTFTALALAQDEPEAPPCDAACQENCAQIARDVVCGLCPRQTTSIPLCASDVHRLTVGNIDDFVPVVYDGNCEIVQAGNTKRLCEANLNPAQVLSRLDIDGDGVPDNSPDTDGDGLPDNWELGGVEETSEPGEDRVVFFPAPAPIVPGTPPTPIFTRRAVATSALLPDTDGDGLSDFVEVFGLMFIDDNLNGILDRNDWHDANGDGLPSPGEFPQDGTGEVNDLPGTFVLKHDFDGFVFTDPTNPDTDGDGVLDGVDRDPLVNPRAFGIARTIIVRFQLEDNPDIDQDGLGNGMDMGNDLLPGEATGLERFQVIDNPANLRELLALFREDLLEEGVVPESAIEDLLGADWDGNGLWRTTDVREWSLAIDPQDSSLRPPDDLFKLDDGKVLYSSQKLQSLMDIFNDPDFQRYGGRGIGLGWQTVLKPPSTNQFIPDKRVWAILYSWRLPGFDIDGDGFIGVPNLTATEEGPEGQGLAMVGLRPNPQTGRLELSDEVPLLAPTCSEGTCSGGLRDAQPCSDDTACITDFPFDDRMPIGISEPSDPSLDGVVQAPPGLSRFLGSLGCGAASPGMLLGIGLALAIPLCRRRRS